LKADDVQALNKEECPAKAIELNWYEDEQLLCKVDALLEGVL